MLKIQSPHNIISVFKDYKLSPSGRDYLKFHALRYFILWGKVVEFAEGVGQSKILKQVQDDKNRTQDEANQIRSNHANQILSDRKNQVQDDKNRARSNHANQIYDGRKKQVKDRFGVKFQNKDSIIVLDIGPGFFTELLGQRFPDLEIHSLGLNPGYFEFISQIIFHKFDLNSLFLNPEIEPEILLELPKFDLICFSEVLEHLYTGPEKTLLFLGKILKPNGVIFIQTPNAVSLRHRILMLFGKNPFPLLRADQNEPGHYREYTLNELKTMLKQADLKLEQAQFHNYFNYFGSRKNKIYKFITRFSPASFRDGIMLEVSK